MLCWTLGPLLVCTPFCLHLCSPGCSSGLAPEGKGSLTTMLLLSMPPDLTLVPSVERAQRELCCGFLLAAKSRAHLFSAVQNCSSCDLL